jgi:hypothetical protein
MYSSNTAVIKKVPEIVVFIHSYLLIVKLKPEGITVACHKCILKMVLRSSKMLFSTVAGMQCFSLILKRKIPSF